MRIDAHHHLWQIGRFDYRWMNPQLEVLHRDYGPEDLQPILCRQHVDRTVLVQTISSVAETYWFLQLAARHPFIAGVVGWVDLTAADVGRVLDELCGVPRLVGIRHQVHDEVDPGWLGRADVQRGLHQLARRSVAYDLLIRPEHLAVSLQVAQRLPELRLIVDHIAKPNIARQDWDDWAAGIAALAKCPNVACKLSGMITEADWQHWAPADLGPYVQHVVEQFGCSRVMFGSDWPVCLLAGTYAQVVEALTVQLTGLSPDEQRQVFGGTAATWYRLSCAT